MVNELILIVEDNFTVEVQASGQALGA